MKTQILLLILIAFLASCKSKTKKYYYDSGELYYETTDIDTSKHLYHEKGYFKNGVVKAEGVTEEVIKGKPLITGRWKEYFSDGVLRYEGDFDRGHLVAAKPNKWPDYAKLPTHLDIEGNPKVLKVGKTYKMRLIMPSIHYSVCRFTNSDLQLMQKNPQDSDRYTYIYTPRVVGTDHLYLIFPTKDTHKFIFAKSLTKLFVLEVEK
jgi:hypothetical protein